MNKTHQIEQYSDRIARLYPELVHDHVGPNRVLSRTVTFMVTNACSLRCKYCVTGDTLIRMSDFSLKPIKDIEVGDSVLGFDEYSEPFAHTKINPALVEQTFHRTDKVLDLFLENGMKLTVTENHPILTRRNSYDSHKNDFTKAGNLKVGSSVYVLPLCEYTDIPEDIEVTSKVVRVVRRDEEVDVYNIGTTSHTYIANGVCVHNCYETHKGNDYMDFDTAKKFVDLLLSGEKGFKDYVDPSYSPAIVLEFIGGEPLLAIDLIDQIVDYFKLKTAEMQHPWATKYMISMCSNGVAYFDPHVQRFLEKNKGHMSFSITIDGNKELHDSCRVFPDGVTGSYDLAVAAAQDWMSRGYYMGSKITIAPGNLPYVYDAILHMVSLGYDEINANCVYEKGWTSEHAQEFYRQLKKIADYWNDNNLVDSHYLSLFGENFFKPKKEDDLENWCGGYSSMLAVDWRGNLYPCIRYVDTALGNRRDPIIIGTVDEGLMQTECTQNCVDCMKQVTRRTKSTDECFYCPIAEGCSDCAAYNYEVFGTVNSRATFICEMHKARALANCYFWNTYYRKHEINRRMKLYVPKDWALNIISEDEYNMLVALGEE